MRKRMNLDMTNMDTLSLLIMADYAAGKTHLMGDFLRWAKEVRKWPVRFLNFAGQDGYSSIAGMGLGEVGETVENMVDYEAALADYRKEGIKAIGVDGLMDLMRFMIIDEIGEMRYPDPKKDGERAKMLWGQIKIRLWQAVMEAKNAVPYVLCTSPIDLSENKVTGSGSVIAPDLIGRSTFASTGWFDMVGYLTVQRIAPGKVKRKIEFETGAGIRTRQRLPVPILEGIEIPKDKGGWEAIYSRIEKAMMGGVK